MSGHSNPTTLAIYSTRTSKQAAMQPRSGWLCTEHLEHSEIEKGKSSARASEHGQNDPLCSFEKIGAHQDSNFAS